MKRILVIALIILIALFMLYCAELDGLIHIEAFAMNNCETCKFIEQHDLDSDAKNFPANVTGAGYEASYELVLYSHFVHGHGKVSRSVLQYNVPYNYCPECGRRITK